MRKDFTNPEETLGIWPLFVISSQDWISARTRSRTVWPCTIHLRWLAFSLYQFGALKDRNRQKWCLHTDGYNYAISSFTAVPSEKISSTLKGPFSVRFRPTMFPKQRTEAFYLWRRLIWVYLIKWINFFIVLQCEKRQCLSPCVVLPSLNELGTNLPSFPGS